jgi:hypothetical protein
VKLVYKNESLSNNCNTWQNIADNPVAISDSFCRNELHRMAVEVCRCTTPNGGLVSELLKETEAPADGEEPTAAPDENVDEGNDLFQTQEPQEDGNDESAKQDSGCLAVQIFLYLLVCIIMTTRMMPL